MFNEFSKIIVDINQEINNRVAHAELVFQYLKNKVIDYNHIEHAIPKEQIHTQSIQTIDLIIHKYSRSNNLVFLSSLLLLEEKFVNTIKDIISKIEGQFEKQVQEKLNNFKILITESEYTVQQLYHDLESAETNVKKKVEQMLEEAINQNNYFISELEEKIKMLDQQANLNPIVTFKNGLSYSLFISIIILLVVGFASYSNSNHISEISNLRSMFTSVLFTGTKWGIISFVIGMLFSAIQAGSTVMDRNYRRQSLVRKIQSLNERRETDIANKRKEGEELEKKMISRIKEKIANHSHRIEELKKEKEKEAVDLRTKFKQQLLEETKDLTKLIQE